MYSTRHNLVLGFHGCDESIRNKVIAGKSDLLKSQNDYDWLGHGIYFWENNMERAFEFAQSLKNSPVRSKKPIKKPSVIGAIIDLGYCLDLLETKSLKILKTTYNSLKNSKIDLPQNKPALEKGELIIRKLDCFVIETLHSFSMANKDTKEYDSVRGVFFEGDELYPNAGFREKDHIQICIRNPNCIKGFFLPRKEDTDFNMV